MKGGKALRVRRKKWYSITKLGGGGVLPYKKLMGTCCWMGSHFHDWIDYNGVTFSKELLELGRPFWDFLG